MRSSRSSARARSTDCGSRPSSSRERARCGHSTSGRCTPRCSASSATGSSRATTAEARAKAREKRYRITVVGGRELDDWLRTPPQLIPPPRDELVIKVLVALEAPGIDVHEVLQAHRRQVIEVMQRYTQVKAAAGEDDVAVALTWV